MRAFYRTVHPADDKKIRPPVRCGSPYHSPYVPPLCSYLLAGRRGRYYVYPEDPGPQLPKDHPDLPAYCIQCPDGNPKKTPPEKQNEDFDGGIILKL